MNWPRFFRRDPAHAEQRAEYIAQGLSSEAAWTNCEPTRAFVPLSSHPSEDRPRVSTQC